MKQSLTKLILIILNELVWRLFWNPRYFKRHTQVDDYHSNPTIGAGYGMARTKNIFELGLQLYLHKTHDRSKSILDLGCGDGAALRLFRLIGFENVLGVEMDAHLVQLARQNEPSAIILLADFTGPNFLKDFGVNMEINTVFAFNPAPAPALIMALRTLSDMNPYTLFLRNPIHELDILQCEDLKVKIRKSFGNLTVLEIEKARRREALN